MMKLARDVGGEKLSVADFDKQSSDLIKQYPEISAILWVDEFRRVKAQASSSSLDMFHLHRQDTWLDYTETEDTYSLAKELRQAIFSPPITIKPREKMGQTETQIQFHIPMSNNTQFKGVVMVEYSIDGLLRYTVPAEITARHAVALVDGNNTLLAGQSIKPRTGMWEYSPWESKSYEYIVPISTIGNSLQLRAQAYRTSQVLIGSGLFGW